jgi:hypothetical protein
LGLVNLIPPGLVVAILAILILSQVFYAFLPYRKRSYFSILVVTAAGFALGQLWDFLGLPSLRMGQANVAPAVAFALLLQPLAKFVPRLKRAPKELKEPKEPKQTEPRT